MSSGTLGNDPRIAAIAALNRELARLEEDGSVTRYNRVFGQRKKLLEELSAEPARDALMRVLLFHQDASVRVTAAWHCGWNRIMPELAEQSMMALADCGHALAPAAANWLENRDLMALGRSAQDQKKAEPGIPFLPVPRGRTPKAGASLIKDRLPNCAPALLRQQRRAIGLWPVTWNGNVLASHLGGLPAVPAGFEWPQEEGEALLFLGQINCAELHGAVGDTAFPDHGILQFYGHPDDLSGAFPTGGCAVLHFTDLGALAPAPPPVEDFQQLIACGLTFYQTVELPDPKDHVFGEIGLSSQDAVAYAALRAELPAHGVPFSGAEGYHSKLLGWPDLVQHDLSEWSDGGALLMQVGWYHDGAESEAWGPGGLVYILLDEDALAARRFEAAQMVVQCT